MSDAARTLALKIDQAIRSDALDDLEAVERWIDAYAAEQTAALRAALISQGNAIDELLTEFVSKKRAANWGIINDAGVAAGRALRAAPEGQ